MYNFLLEKEFIYGEYEIGDIVFVKKYYYQKNHIGENHLFLLIQKIKNQYVGLLISSNTHKLIYETNQLLVKTNENGLCKNSVLKLDKWYLIKRKEILFRIGKIEKGKVRKILNSTFSFE